VQKYEKKTFLRTFANDFNKICEMNKSHIFGYLLGLLIFVIGIPALMWLVSRRPWPYTATFRIALTSNR
jgi:hypothetical protein